MSVSPPLVRQVDVWLDGDELRTRRNGTAQPLGHEVVLRDLLAVDLEDAVEVAAFLSEHGEVTLPASVPWPVPTAGEPGWREVAEVLGAARVLVHHWIASEKGEPVVPAWSRPDLTHDDVAWAVWADNLNHGLAGLHVRVEVDLRGSRVGLPEVDLYGGLCAQLFNVMADDIPVRQCDNETCGRWMQRQEGRSEQGQHRSKGVMYCSRACARAQAERARRRRKRGE